MTELIRPDPDSLLAEVMRQEAQSKMGKLHIFLGMCPGVGKTFAMLQAAAQRQREGTNLLVGIVETHGRRETADLLNHLEVLPRKTLPHRDHPLTEFDLDAVLERRPDLVLVDELAHTNAPGSRHTKRYQDVLELLSAGIDVYTTVNVQHIESQVDTVRQITGVTIQETVPDSILDHAHEIELIDISVDKLLDRMAAGKVYLGDRAEHAMSNFFKEGNLTALREMALRFTAEHVDRDLENIRRSHRVTSPWKTNARLLLGVGPSPYAESLIRWTRRAATRLNCPWLIVWVESTTTPTPEAQKRLTASLALARQLGAEIVNVTGEDIATAILQVARERNVTQIVVGKPGKRRLFRPTLADQIIAQSGDIDVCVVRPTLATNQTSTPSKNTRPLPSPATLREYAWAIGITAVTTLIGFPLLPLTGYFFVGLLFLLTIILSSLRLTRGPVLLMATLNALCWNFLFIQPYYTFQIQNLHDSLMFGMFFIIALSMGHLTTRLRQRERAERQRQRQTAALLSVTQSAALSAQPDQGLAEALRTINELLNAQTAIVTRHGDHTLHSQPHPASTFIPTDKEWGVIHWSYDNKKPAGRFTDTLPVSDATWFPLQTATSILGVIGLKRNSATTLDFLTRQSIEAFALQIALVLEKEHFIAAIKHAELLAQSEHLQRTLLDSVSHELKTPLAIIQTSLDALDTEQNPYLDEIHTASQRLQRVVNNLLQITRIESTTIQPQSEWCTLSDLIHEALDTVQDDLTQHPIHQHLPDPAPTISLDPKIFTQAIANLIHNATTYTPPQTPIDIHASIENQKTLTLTVRDHGPGLPPDSTEKIFTKFYRLPGSPTGGTGLGLSIARALIRSLNGTLTAANHPQGGALFTIKLPVSILNADP
ncbi:sensor histidine kinase KdpD [Phragmitibacter flavus]|uniref:histidine kinase n=1 Tax=Phragmitibacter flavus TaxID=2576071 RepID=A0A5R8KF61_9BACT|nr:sensor histidine kinase KdpD [Phragmitibacter flavus]TLD70249.1 sensor histidine kinase KdpD [Phragmitibacter flavus]